jgi:hypothetical protein
MHFLAASPLWHSSLNGNAPTRGVRTLKEELNSSSKNLTTVRPLFVEQTLTPKHTFVNRQNDLNQENREKTDETQCSGGEALQRRDQLEAFVTAPFPHPVQKWVSAALTSVTGLAPTARAGHPIWKGSVRRAVIYMATLMIVGAALVLGGAGVWKLVGSLALVSAMRNFTAGVGHHLLHSRKGLGVPEEVIERGYNIAGAVLLLPAYERARPLHLDHHKNVGGNDDPDQHMIEFVGMWLNGPIPFIVTLLNPWFHAKFIGNVRNSVESSGSARTHSTTPFSV